MKFLWHASCILLGSAMLMAYCLKIEIREMVSFGLGKEIEKDFFCLVTSVGQRKNSESPWGIEPQTFRFHALMLYHWATETPWWARSNIKFIWHTSYVVLKNQKEKKSLPSNDNVVLNNQKEKKSLPSNDNVVLNNQKENKV